MTRGLFFVVRGVAVAATLSAYVLVNAADWPKWRGPQGTGHAASGEKFPKEIAANPTVIWRKKVGEGLASPVVAKGKLIYFDAENGKEVIRVMNLADQKEVWKAEVDETFKDSQGPAGPRATPLVDGDRVYAQSCRGELQCRQLSDGKLVWRTSYTTNFGAVFIGEKGTATGATRHGNNGSPIIDGNRLFANVGSKEGASVVCFDKRDGKVIWKGGSDEAGYAPPARGKLAGVEHVVAFTAESVLGLDAGNGKELWRIPVKTAYGRHVTTPIIHKDHVIVSSHQVGLMAIKVTKSGSGVEATTVWTSKEGAMNFASPVLVGDHIYGVGPAKNLICVDTATGKVAWSQTGVIATSADKAHAGFVVMNDRVLALTDSGEVVLFAADPTKFQEFGRAQVAGVNWCNPAYADGKLYVREGIKTTGEIVCVDLVK